MSRLVAFFVDRYVGAISVFLAIGLFGVVSYLGLGVDLLPAIDVPVVAISTVYPGAGSEEVSRQVSEPIESAVATLAGLGSVTSISSEGLSLVIVQFASGVDEDQAAVDVSQKIDAIVNRLPSDATSPTILKFDPADQPILNLAVSAPGRDMLEVQRYVEDALQPRLQRVEGVAEATVTGPVEREIQVLLDPGRLATYDLSPLQVANAIAGSAVDVPLGSLTFSDSRILLAGRNTPENLDAVGEIPVDGGRGLRVVDVATVRDTAAEVVSYARLDGRPVVLLEVQKASGGNSVATSRAVRKAMRSVELPEGFTAEIVGDTTTFTEATIADTLTELLISTLAVTLVIVLFVGRLGTILAVLLSIPVSIAGALIVIGLFGFTLNLITLLAITVAVGLVVDDAIVVAENIDRFRKLGYSIKDAVIEGASEVSTAVLAATLSLLAVFIPISLLPGIIGQFFAQFGITMAAAIVFSYLEAMFFLTVRLALSPDPLPPGWNEFGRTFGRLGVDVGWTLRLWRRPWFWGLAALIGVALAVRVGPPALALLAALPPALLLGRYLGRIVLFFGGAILLSLFRFGTWLVDGMRDAYARSLAAVLGRAWVVLFAAALLLASLVLVAPRIGFEFAPRSDGGAIDVAIELPSGTNLDRTNGLAGRIESVLLADPNVDRVLTSVGATDDTGRSRPELASFSVELIKKGERELSTFELVPILKERLGALLAPFPEADLSVAPGDIGGDGGGGPPDNSYTLTLVATDFELLREREGAVREALERRPELVNVGSSLASTVSESVFVVDDARLNGTGLSAGSVYQTLRAYNLGIEAAKFRAEGEEVPILVRADPLLLADEEALLSLPIFAPVLGTELPIGQLGRFEVRDAPVTINRSNQTYSVDFSADLAPDAPDLFTVRGRVGQALRDEGLIGGAVTEGAGSELDLLGDLVLYAPIAFGLALLLNYLVIATQFNSFRFPLYLQLTVPLALIGVFWLFFLTDTAFDVISILGIVMLVGLVVKNAILLLEVLMGELEDGSRSLKEALIEAARLRFRPILMTTLTVVIISAPLILGIGEGSEFRYPLGLIIFSGVLTSALLTFYVVPAAFYTFERRRFEKERGGALVGGDGADMAASEGARQPRQEQEASPRPV